MDAPGAKPTPTADEFRVVRGIAFSRPRGKATLVEAVDRIARAISMCRERAIAALFIDATGLTGMSIPTLVDRFLAVEDWAQRSQSMATVELVISERYRHPQKFGVQVAKDFGLTMDAFGSAAEAMQWLSPGRAKR